MRTRQRAGLLGLITTTKMMSASVMVTMLMTLLMTLLGGCSLYVNIPRQAGDVARHDPNMVAVGEAEEVALRYLMNDRPMKQPVQIVLPAETSPETYQAMMPQIGELATYNLDGEREDMPTLKVERVLIRHPLAELDVMRPAFIDEPLGPTEMVTVYMKWKPFSGWRVERLRVWRLNAGQGRATQSY